MNEATCFNLTNMEFICSPACEFIPCSKAGKDLRSKLDEQLIHMTLEMQFIDKPHRVLEKHRLSIQTVFGLTAAIIVDHNFGCYKN